MTSPSTPTIPQQIAALSRQVTGLSDAVTALTTRLAAVESRPVPDVSGATAQAAAAQKVAQEALAATKGYATLVTEVKAELARVAGLTDGITPLANRVTGAEKTATTAREGAEAVRGTVTALESRVAALEGAPPPVIPPDLSEDLARVRTQVQDLASTEPPTIPPDLTAEVQALTSRIEALAPADPADLAPLYDSLNEVRDVLGMTRVQHGGEAETPDTTPEVSAEAVAAADEAVSTVATAAEDRAAPLSDHLRRLLDGAGLTTDTLIARASDAELLAISGIGGETLKMIRAEIPAQDAQKDGE